MHKLFCVPSKGMNLECQTVLITWGPFLNYVEQIFPFLTIYLPFGEGIHLLLHIEGNLPVVDISILNKFILVKNTTTA